MKEKKAIYKILVILEGINKYRLSCEHRICRLCWKSFCLLFISYRWHSVRICLKVRKFSQLWHTGCWSVMRCSWVMINSRSMNIFSISSEQSIYWETINITLYFTEFGGWFRPLILPSIGYASRKVYFKIWMEFSISTSEMAASFAARLAAFFPAIPTCYGIHIKFRETSEFMSLLRWLRRVFDDDVFNGRYRWQGISGYSHIFVD